MINNRKINLYYTTIIMTILVLSTITAPISFANNKEDNEGFNKGPSIKPVIPIKKVTLVNFDENKFLDDYSYLAAVPTAVFYNKDMNAIYSNPLLFYQDYYPVKEDKERTLNARQGLDYFMEDWMSYCTNQLDKAVLINVPKNKLNSSWKADEYESIEGNNPYDIANELALKEWSYSNNAVIAVIQEEFEKPNNITEGSVSGSLSSHKIKKEHFEIEQPIIGTGGTYKTFDVNDYNYRYLLAQLTWPNSIDFDLQLYDTRKIMVDNVARGYPEVPRFGLAEVVGSFIHNYGKWQVSVTAVPVKKIETTVDKEQNEDIFNGLGLVELAKALENVCDVDISFFPGTIVDIPDVPSFGIRDVDFTLTWDNPDIRLGFTLLDPVGTEICSSFSKEGIESGEYETKGEKITMHVDRLGECIDDDRYSLCVFSLDDITKTTNFNIEYSWHQNFSKMEGECFASASNGAVLASVLNAPMLYTSPSEISKETKDVLYKIGINNIYLINIGGHLSKNVKDELDKIAQVTDFENCKDIYSYINSLTGNNLNIVFTTIDPWTYWYVAEDKPAGEYPGALFVGPAAFIAAHHGTPVIIIDIHPKLTQANVYPTDFWVKAVKDRIEPTSGSLYSSGMEIYDFLEEYGLGKLEEGKAAKQIQETIITVADQYDIGAPWDRMYTGAALNGRFCFSPVDTANWISRNVFYPAMIFVNPAATQEKVKMINGSSSKSKLIGGRIQKPYGSTLVITKPSQEEEFIYPILHTYNVYGYKFNEKAWKHWDFKFSTAEGIIPYETPSPDAIDDGATNKVGAYYPDMSESEVIPFYATRAGYSNVYSTNFTATVDNLNRGVIIWVENCHGWQRDGGLIAMWDPNNPYHNEDNPWRAYEPILFYPGHLREFVRWLIYGMQILSGNTPSPSLSDLIIKFHILPEIGSTENPDVALANPQLVIINRIAQKLGLPTDLWGANGIMIYRDRLKHPIQSLLKGLPLINIYDGDGKVIISPNSGSFNMIAKNGTAFDNALGNVHSCGLNTISCLPAYTYLHMTWMRHGMSYQIIDPWTTTDWGGVWTQMLVKRFAMGDTIGQAYELGMRACGPEFIVGQWWWDKWENVELFGDPNLRVFVPGTEYSDANYWEKEDTESLRYDAEFSIDGHMPFGVTSYPNETEPTTFWQQNFWLILIIIAIAILAVFAVFLGRKRNKKY